MDLFDASIYFDLIITKLKLYFDNIIRDYVVE